MESKVLEINNLNPSNNCIKGAIHWYSAKKPNKDITSLKCRPFIIISKTNYRSKRVLMSPIQNLENYTENGQVKYPYHIKLLKKDYEFLDKDSVILLDQVYTVSKDELLKECYIGSISEFKELDKGIIYNFDLYESINQAFSDLLCQFKEQYVEEFSRR